MKCETCKHIDHELSHISDWLWDIRCNAGDWKNDTLIVEETLPWVTDIVCLRYEEVAITLELLNLRTESKTEVNQK